jgi:hypothetical protein
MPFSPFCRIEPALYNLNILLNFFLSTVNESTAFSKNMFQWICQAFPIPILCGLLKTEELVKREKTVLDHELTFTSFR